MGVCCRRMLMVFGAAVLILLPGGPSGAADEPLWKESPGLAPAPEIARLNNVMNELAERLKPALVQVRVKRAVDVHTEGADPYGRPEGRRSSRSGLIIRQDCSVVSN